MRITPPTQQTHLFRLRTILMIVMLSVLLLPVASLYFFRFYSNELVRQTEVELISQSAVFSAVYRELTGHNAMLAEGVYTPIRSYFDLSSETILPPRPHAIDTTAISDSLLLNQPHVNMYNILRNTQAITLAGIRILDEKGIVIVGRNEVGQSLAHVQEVKGALAGQYASVIRERRSDEAQPALTSLSRGTGIRVFTAFPIIDKGHVYGVIYLSRTPQNIVKHLYSIKEKVVLVIIILLVMTGLLVSFMSSRLSRPIAELRLQAQKVTRGEVDTVDVIAKPGSYEVEALSRSIAEMSYTLQERGQYIQEFASHVSHEFKTPLTSMQASLELLQEHKEMSEEQQQRFLSNLQGDTERLKNLVTRLLEQARADTLATSSSTSHLIPILNSMRAQYKKHNIDLSFDEIDLDVELHISTDALESVLINLFDNSQSHGANTITLVTKATKEKGLFHLHIQDNGTGISPANKERIFTPFFTTRREQGGTGLGLGIITATLKAWKGAIALQDSDLGALFSVTLPLKNR